MSLFTQAELDEIRQIVADELNKRSVATVSVNGVWQAGVFGCQHDWEYKPQTTASGYLRVCRKCGIGETTVSTS